MDEVLWLEIIMVSGRKRFGQSVNTRREIKIELTSSNKTNYVKKTLLYYKQKYLFFARDMAASHFSITVYSSSNFKERITPKLRNENKII
jgi:hypothetical protein